MDLGQHAIFIWASYAIVFAVVGGLILWLVGDGRRLQRRLDQLEAAGAKRRSDRGARQ